MRLTLLQTVSRPPWAHSAAAEAGAAARAKAGKRAEAEATAGEGAKAAAAGSVVPAGRHMRRTRH
jgi:hypothetical protein